MFDHGSFPQQASKLNLNLDTFQSNRAAWENVIARFDDGLATASGQGAAQSLLKHQERGQLLGTFDVATEHGNGPYRLIML